MEQGTDTSKAPWAFLRFQPRFLLRSANTIESSLCIALLASSITCMSPLGDLEQYATFCFYLCTQESELYMLNMRERTDVLFKRFSRLSLLRLVGKAILGLLTLQVLTAAVLLVIAMLGKRRIHEVSF